MFICVCKGCFILNSAWCVCMYVYVCVSERVCAHETCGVCRCLLLHLFLTKAIL